VADFSIPADLLDLQRAFCLADARCEEISAALPPSMAIYEGVEVDWSELNRARAERIQILDQIAAHPWLASQGDQMGTARNALRAAARASAK